MRSGTLRLAWPSAIHAGLAFSWLVSLPAPATAADQFPATSFFAKGLHPGSSWSEILSTPEIMAEFPDVPFGNAYLPLNRTCLDSGALQPLDAPPGGGPATTAGAPRWSVSVYRVVAVVPVTHRAFLFTKGWEVSPCRRP